MNHLASLQVIARDLLEKQAGARARFLAQLLLKGQGQGAPLKALERGIARTMGNVNAPVLPALRGHEQPLLEGLARRHYGLYGTDTIGNINAQRQLGARPLTTGLPQLKPPGTDDRIRSWQALRRAQAQTRLEQTMDNIAMSGRHGKPTVLSLGPDYAPSITVPGQAPSTAYKGYVGPSPYQVIGAKLPTQPRIPQGLPQPTGKPGDPQWWTAHPEVATEYMSRISPSYLAQASIPGLQRNGPLGPWQQHLSKDSRPPTSRLGKVWNWLNQGFNNRFKAPAAGPIPQSGDSVRHTLGRLPHYERVATQPPVPIQQYSTVSKLLPSGTGFQQVH